MVMVFGPDFLVAGPPPGPTAGILGATYTPQGGSDIIFGLLLENPGRSTRATISERSPVGGNLVVIDIVGKAVTKIKGKGRIDSMADLETFERAIGTTGLLTYAEGTFSVDLVSIGRSQVTASGVQLFDLEFWLA